MNPRENLESLIAERKPFSQASATRSEHMSRIQTERALSERELANGDAEQEKHDVKVAAAIAANEKMPEPSAALRQALAKVPLAKSTLRALDHAQQQLEAENTSAARGLAKLEAKISTALAQVHAEWACEFHAKGRDLHDELVINEGVRGAVERAMAAADPRVAGEIQTALENARVEWIRERDARIRNEIARRTAEILGTIPS